MRVLGTIAAGLIASMALAQDVPNHLDPVGACVSIYSGALTRLSADDRVSIGITNIAEQSCSNRELAIGVGFDSKSQSIINQVPAIKNMLGNLNIQNREQFCRAYEKGDFQLTSASKLTKEPVADAMAQANSCLDIATRGIVVRHTVLGPGTVTFQGYPTRPDTTIRLSTSVEPKDGWECTSPRPNTQFVDIVGRQEIRRDSLPFEVTCTRAGHAAAGIPDIAYPYGAVTLTIGSAGSYTVIQRPDTAFGVRSASEANQRLDELSNAKQSLEHLKTESDTKISSLEGRKYSPVTFNFSDREVDQLLGETYDCRTYNLPEESRLQSVVARQCQGGRLLNVKLTLSPPGVSCGGYNRIMYTAVCEQPPDK